MLQADNFTDEKLGCTPQVSMVATEDKVISPEFQRWMIETPS